MKTIQEVLDNYENYETCLDDRFGIRLTSFLTVEQCEKLGFKFKEEYANTHNPIEWSEENVISQLLKDAEFGKEKAEDERGISSNLMYEVCKSWCKILGKDNLILYYNNYGLQTFENIINKIKEI